MFFPEHYTEDEGSNRLGRTVFSIVILALAYYTTARFCLTFSLGDTNVSPVWLPSGLAFAAVWILGYRVWPGVFLGALAVNASAFFAHNFADPWTIGILSYTIAIGNMLEAVVGCFVLKRLVRNLHPLHSVDDVLKFFFVSLGVSFANALFGPAALCLLGKVPWAMFTKMSLTWWLGDASGILTVAPVLFLFHQYKRTQWQRRRFIEAVLLFLALIFVNIGIFGGEFLVTKAYLLLPVVVWCAYRFGIMGASIATLMTIGIAMGGTIVGGGPFADSDLNTSFFLLLPFVGIILITGLILAAALRDRRWALDKADKNEQRFRSLVENSSDMISVLSPDAVTLYASPSTTKVLGYTVEEYVGRNAFDFIHLEDTAHIIKVLSKILENPGRSQYGSCRFQHKDGSWRWLEGTGINLLSDPAVSGIVVNYRDITVKKKAQEDQLYLSAIIENSEDGIMAMSLDGIITSWNHGAEKIYGYTHAEIIGKFAKVLIPEDRLQELSRIIEELKAGHKISPLETVRLRKDGQLINISLRASPIKNHNGELIGASAIVRDITERKKSELVLRESENRFRKMADTAPVMVWVSGRDTLWAFCNRAWLDFTGRKLEEEIGSGWSDSVHQDDRQRTLDQYLTAFDRREQFSNEFRLRRWDGEYRWIMNTGVPRFSGDQKFEGFIGSCVDITEHRLAEDILKRDAESLKKTVEERSKELDKMQVELKKASRLADIGTLAATVAHELRNPLGVIQMAAFNLKKRHPELAEERHLTNIDKKVWESERIINNLLIYAKVRVPRYEEIALIRALDNSLTTIQGRFHDAQISVERNYAVDPEFLIHADQLQLTEILNNVLMNAFQAFPEKKGAVMLSVVRHNGNAQILVKDTGVGIDAEHMDKIFVPFFTTKAKGTGLGLSICNELVHLHNGTIDIISEKGKGTTVTIDFPIQQEQGGARD